MSDILDWQSEHTLPAFESSTSPRCPYLFTVDSVFHSHWISVLIIRFENWKHRIVGLQSEPLVLESMYDWYRLNEVIDVGFFWNGATAESRCTLCTSRPTLLSHGIRTYASFYTTTLPHYHTPTLPHYRRASMLVISDSSPDYRY